jgi:hypothetical protein
VQAAQHEELLAELDQQDVERPGRRADMTGGAKGQRHVAEVQQVERQHDQPAHRVGQPLVAEQGGHHDPAAARQRGADDDSESDAGYEVDEGERDDHAGHLRPGIHLNMFNISRTPANVQRSRGLS